MRLEPCCLRVYLRHLARLGGSCRLAGLGEAGEKIDTHLFGMNTQVSQEKKHHLSLTAKPSLCLCNFAAVLETTAPLGNGQQHKTHKHC